MAVGKKVPFLLLLILVIVLWSTGVAVAQDGFNTDLDYPQVTYVKAVFQGASWTFSVTVHHRDEGWAHYADRWQVLEPVTGRILAERILAHPHDTEQPFTRSMRGISIPEDVNEVLVRAGCTIHDFGGRQVLVRLAESVKTREYVVVR